MPETLIVMESQGGHEAMASSLASQLSQSVGFVDVPVNNGTGISEELPQPLIPFSAYYTSNFTPPGTQGLPGSVIGTLVNDGTAQLLTMAGNGIDPVWHAPPVISGGAASPGLVSNGVTPPLDKRATTPTGRNAPGLAVKFLGAAATAYRDGGDLISVSGTYTWAYGPRTPYRGLAHWAAFEDDALNTISNGTQVVAEHTQYLAAPSTPYVLGVDALNNTIQCDACQFSAVGPNCAVYVLASDLGNGPDLIPAAVTDNTASRFQFHPSVFMRRTSYIRTVQRQYRDFTHIAAPIVGQAVRIVQLNPTPQQHSTWLIIVDGVAQVVRLLHEIGSLAQRPRDIWNQVWVPLINGPSAVSLAPILSMADGAGTTGPGISQLRLSRLEYARYLGPGGTDITQTGANPA